MAPCREHRSGRFCARGRASGDTLTFSERLAATQGRPAGFDYIRVGLALAIVALHTVLVSYGVATAHSLITGPTRPVWALLLPMFFSLSGFLISGSLERSPTLVGFFALRVLRLVPALATETLISMLMIGPLLTSLALATYFSDRTFWAYALNLVGHVHFYLPGVFATNPVDWVNGQLWTLKYELYCYSTLAFMALFGLYRKSVWLIAFCALIQCLVVVKFRYDVPMDLGIVPGLVLVPSFLFGSLLYRLRDQVVWSPPWFWISVAVAVTLLSFPVTNALAAFPVSYLTVFLGLLNPRRMSLVSSGDYSYSIYLYGFPIQQVIAALFPGFRHWWFNMAIALPVVCLASYGSWHLIEKRCLRLRRHLIPFEHVVLQLHGRSAVVRQKLVVSGLQSRWVPKHIRELYLARRATTRDA